jgi:hypothetical protein
LHCKREFYKILVADNWPVLRYWMAGNDCRVLNGLLIHFNEVY